MKTVKIRKLLILLLGIISIITACLVYSYYYILDPSDIIKGVKHAVDYTKQPKFLFAINNELDHPLENPSAVLVIKNKIYVSDTSKGRLLVFDYNGKFERYLKPGEASFKAPYGLAFDGSVLYVADPGSSKIYMFNSKGNFLKVFETKVKLASPGVLLFQEGKLYVSDQLLHKVMVFDTRGNLLRSYGSEGHQKGQLYFPHGLMVDQKGSVYVADSGNDRIQAFKADGTAVEVIGGQIATPRGMVGDENGNLWVVEGLANKLPVLKTDGTLVTVFGEQGREYGQLALPNGVYIDQNNRVYVTEFGNSRVSVFTY